MIYGNQPRLPNYVLFFLAALFCVFLENIPAFDRLLQRAFYQDGAWVLTKQFHAHYKALLYTAPKVLIAIIGSVFLFIFLFAAYKTKAGTVGKHLSAWKKPALLAFLSIALVPLLIAAIKAISGVYSPRDLLPYGGQHPHTGLIQQLWIYGHTAGGRSFPAGHASGGFALMSLYYLPLPRSTRKALLAWGLGAGWIMGIYQTARGEHFISHTLTTMFIALALITFLAHKLRLSKPEKNHPGLTDSNL